MVGVRQQRVLEIEQVRYVLPRAGIFYTNGQNLSFQFLEVRIVFLQLPELRPARPSPAGPVEDQDDVLQPLVRREGDRVAPHRREAEVARLLSSRWYR